MNEEQKAFEEFLEEHKGWAIFIFAGNVLLWYTLYHCVLADLHNAFH